MPVVLWVLRLVWLTMSSGASHSWNHPGDPPVPSVGDAPSLSPPGEGQVPTPTRAQLQGLSDEFLNDNSPGWTIAQPTSPNPTLVYEQVSMPAGACRLWVGPVDVACDAGWLQRLQVGHNVSHLSTYKSYTFHSSQ